MCGASAQGEKLAGIFRLLIGTPGSCIIYRDNPGKNGMVGRYAIGVEKASFFCSGVSFTGSTFPLTFVWKRRGLSRELRVAHARFGVDVRRKFDR